MMLRIFKVYSQDYEHTKPPEEVWHKTGPMCKVWFCLVPNNEGNVAAGDLPLDKFVKNSVSSVS